MRIFDRTVRVLVAGLMLSLGVITAATAAGKYRSAQDALDQGIGAFNGGYYEIAIPALEYAADAHLFLAPYYLARIYSDNNGSRTDHAKAYKLYLKIAGEHTDVDPDDDQRAPYVAKAMTRIAGYLLNGLPEVNLKPNAKIAMEYLREAAQFFRDEDAQFELAKLYLHGDGIESDVPYAKHWLSVLSQKGHAGAQAFLADLLWRGKYMKTDPVRALALISVAVANAPAYERVWIEDIYHSKNHGRFNSQTPADVATYNPLLPVNPETNMVNMRVGMRLSIVDASLFVNNATNEHPVMTVADAFYPDPRLVATTWRPRTIGINGTFRF